MYHAGVSLSFEWSEFLSLARKLTTTSPGSGEASLRSAISRAYYAAFCCARNHLRDKERHSIPATGQAHTYVRSQFQTSTDSPRRAIGQQLDRLRIARNKADYDDTVTGLPHLTEASLIWAEEVIRRLVAL